MRTLLVLALLAALPACGKEPAAVNGSGAAATTAAAAAAGKIDRRRAGQPAPDTRFDDPDGDPATFADFEGKPALVNFWATWCAPCKKELPALDRLAAEQGGRLQVVTIAEDDPAKAAAYMQDARLAKLENWTDAKLTLTDALKIADLPTTILFDAKGREVWRVRGELDWQGAQAKALVAEALR